jgi:DNA-directed RNA polymerase specialized sigma24 family protein
MSAGVCHAGHDGQEWLGMRRIEASASEVQRFVSRRVQNPADAADLAQQTLLLACSKLHTFRGERILSWLQAIAQHLIIDYYRMRHRVHFVGLTPGTADDLDSALQTPGEAVLAVYRFRQCLEAWQGDSAGDLNIEHQVAVLLADAYGYRDRDSAALLQMSVPSFKLLLHESRARVKALEPSGAGERNTAANGGSRPRPLPFRAGVACRVAVDDLRALRSKLIDGLTEAVLSCPVAVSLLELADAAGGLTSIARAL